MYEQLNKIHDSAEQNEMKLNISKTKFMLFNPIENYDFIPDIEVDGLTVEIMEEMKLFGLVVRNDLSWKSNTENMVKKAYKRLWIVKRLKQKGETRRVGRHL